MCNLECNAAVTCANCEISFLCAEIYSLFGLQGSGISIFSGKGFWRNPFSASILFWSPCYSSLYKTTFSKLAKTIYIYICFLSLASILTETKSVRNFGDFLVEADITKSVTEYERHGLRFLLKQIKGVSEVVMSLASSSMGILRSQTTLQFAPRTVHTVLQHLLWLETGFPVLKVCKSFGILKSLFQVWKKNGKMSQA